MTVSVSVCKETEDERVGFASRVAREREVKLRGGVWLGGVYLKP